MRIKAAASLERLKKMKTKKRRAKSFSEVDPETWTQIKFSRGFGIGYIKIVDKKDLFPVQTVGLVSNLD